MEYVMSDQINPLLAKLRIPGETFQIPSQGVFYINGELDSSVVNGELEIFPMTTIDEIIFSTPDKLLSGKAVVEVFSRCIPQILQPLELLTKDIDFLLICLRLVTFGPTMEVTYQHTCENALEHKYKVDLQKLVRSAIKIDPTSISQTYNVLLSNGQQVILQPIKYRRLLRIYDILATQKTTEDLSVEDKELNVIIMLSCVIQSVDNVSDQVLIEEWLRKLGLNIKQEIQKVINEMSDWGIDFVVTPECEDCGETIVLPIAANPVSFFFQQ